MTEKPETYNDWVQVIENNDPGVAAQMVVASIKRIKEEND